MKRNLTAVLFLVALLVSPACGQSKKYSYPPATAGTVKDNYHGTIVVDPYRWMEDESSPELKEWIMSENKLTEQFLSAIPEREALKQRIGEVWSYPRMSVPYRKGVRYFFWKNNGLQNQDILHMQEGLTSFSRPVLDPNALSADGTVSVSLASINNDGTLLAYGLSRSGSDWQEIMIRDLTSGKDFPEVLTRCKFSSAAWSPDSKGFYYTRYPDEGAVAKEDENAFNRIYWHSLGTQQSEDKLVCEKPDEKDVSFGVDGTDDGAYLLLTLYVGTEPKNRIYYRGTGLDAQTIPLIDTVEAEYNFIDNIGTTFYFTTDLDAPRGRIISIDITKPDRAYWKEIVPQSENVLSSVALINNKLVATSLKDAQSVLTLYDLNGVLLRTLSLPGSGTVGGLSGRANDTEMFFDFTTFTRPSTNYRYEFDTQSLSVFWTPKLTFDVNAFETRQVFCNSKDGTRVPIFITGKKGMRLDGKNPVLLYGYGGFNITKTPSFDSWRIPWLESGGVFVVANLRGGGEYGEEWYRAGTLERKQNVFDDFIAAAEWLVSNNYTIPSRLAITGASNGGLLVAACMLQRPDLFGAVVCRVPVTDMLRYHKFTIGRYWTGDYGNAEENPDHFKFLYAYSPLHNIRKGATYPPTLITTADHDDRVVPAHAMKFAAALQAKDSGRNPLLLRVDVKAGHGAGKPISKLIDEWGDITAFLFQIFSMSMQ